MTILLGMCFTYTEISSSDSSNPAGTSFCQKLIQIHHTNFYQFTKSNFFWRKFCLDCFSSNNVDSMEINSL